MVVARETVSLYGRVLSSGRQVNFATVDPATARRMFVEEALVRRPVDAAGPRSSSATQRVRDAARAPRGEAAAARPAGRRRTRWCGSTSSASRRTLRRRELRALVACRGAPQPHRLDAPREVLLAQPLPQVAHGATTRDTWMSTATCCALHYRFDPTEHRRRRDARRAAAAAAGRSTRRAARLAGARLAGGEGHRAAARPAEGAAPRARADPRRGGAIPARRLAIVRRGNLFEQLARFVTAETGKRYRGRDAARRSTCRPRFASTCACSMTRGHELRRGRDLEVLRRDLRTVGSRSSPRRPGWSVGARRSAAVGLRRPGRRSHGSRAAGVTLRMFPGIEDAGATVRLRLYPDAARGALPDAGRRRAARGAGDAAAARPRAAPVRERP